MRNLLTAIGLLVAMATAHAEDKLPDLFTKKQFSSATLADAANYYISLGEKRAIEKLKSLEEDHAGAIDRGFHCNERIGWICRIVFQGPQERPLRQPRYGGLGLPHLTMPLERWPLYPVAESDEVFFVLSEGYMLAGRAERATDYIDYCSANGSFRRDKVKIPTRTEAVAAYDALKMSERWKLIIWKDEGPGTKYTVSEEWVLSYLKAQATAIPEN